MGCGVGPEIHRLSWRSREKAPSLDEAASVACEAGVNGEPIRWARWVWDLLAQSCTAMRVKKQAA